MKEHKILIVCSFIFLLLSLVLPSILFYPDIFTTPDENINFFFINLYRDSGSLVYYEPLNTIKDLSIIIPRGTIFFYEQVVPVFSSGIALIYGGITTIDTEILYIIPLVISFIAILYLYLFLKLFYSKKTSFISCILLIIFPPVWYSFIRYTNLDLLVLSFLIISSYYFILFTNKKKSAFILLSSFFMSLGLLINIRSIFLIFSLLLAFILVNLLFNSSKDYRKTVALIIKYGLLLIFFSLTIFIINLMLYKNIFLLGYKAQTLYTSSIGGLSLPLFFFIPQQMANNILLYFISIDIVVFMGFILGLIFYFKEFYNKQNNKIYLLTMFIYITISFLYLSNIAVTWSNVFSLGSSFMRYLLPLYLLTIPISVNYILNYLGKISKSISIFFIFLIIINSFLVVSISNQGLLDLQVYKINSKDTRDKILLNTNNKSVIFTQYYDKIIFPYRKVAAINYLPGENINGEWYEDTNVLTNIIYDLLIKENINIYIINDGSLNWESFTDNLYKKKLHVTEVVKLTDSVSLYEVVKNVKV